MINVQEKGAQMSHSCTCTDTNCPFHPTNHNQGCDLCIIKCLKEKEIPSCFFKSVNVNTSNVKDYTYQGFSRFLERNGGQ
jgi:hypothetical protein